MAQFFSKDDILFSESNLHVSIPNLVLEREGADEDALLLGSELYLPALSNKYFSKHDCGNKQWIYTFTLRGRQDGCRSDGVLGFGLVMAQSTIHPELTILCVIFNALDLPTSMRKSASIGGSESIKISLTPSDDSYNIQPIELIKSRMNQTIHTLFSIN